MDTYDIRQIFDALGTLADNTAPDGELADNVSEVASSLDNIHSLLDEGLSQINANLGRIADALESAKPWDEGFSAGYEHGKKGAGPSAPKPPNPYASFRAPF